MKLKTIIICLFCLCFAGNHIFADNHQPDNDLHRQLAEIQQALFNDQFEDALALCAKIIENNPVHPAGYSFKAAIQMAHMTDHEENIYEQQFKKLIDSTITIAKEILEKQTPEQKAWTYLWMGNAHAYRALYDSRFGSFYGAVKSGMRAKGAFQTGLENDSTNHDLLVGLGSYHYWKSAKAGVLRWIGIFKNQKQQGIEELTKANKSATLFAESAKRAMIWIWLNEKQYDSVIAVAEELFDKYPDGKTVLWPMAEALVKLKRYPEAIEVYKTLRNQIAINPGNYYNLIECDYLLSETLKKNSGEIEALELANNTNKYFDQIPDHIRKRQKNRLKYFERLKE